MQVPRVEAARESQRECFAGTGIASNTDLQHHDKKPTQEDDGGDGDHPDGGLVPDVTICPNDGQETSTGQRTQLDDRSIRDRIGCDALCGAKPVDDRLEKMGAQDSNRNGDQPED